MLSKTSVDEVFMHHFEKMSSASGNFASPTDPHRGAAPGPCWGTSVLQTPSLPTLEKILRAPMPGGVGIRALLHVPMGNLQHSPVLLATITVASARPASSPFCFHRFIRQCMITSEPRRHSVEMYASAARTTDGRP